MIPVCPRDISTNEKGQVDYVSIELFRQANNLTRIFEASPYYPLRALLTLEENTSH